MPLFGGAVFLLGADMLWKPQFTRRARKTVYLTAFLTVWSPPVLCIEVSDLDDDADYK